MTTKPTTETRTLEKVEDAAAALVFSEHDEKAARALIQRAYALGAASRASPDEGRLRDEDMARERLLYDVLWKAREVLSRCNLDGSANLNRKETAALRDAVRDFDQEDERLHDAKRSPPPPTREDAGRDCGDCATTHYGQGQESAMREAVALLDGSGNRKGADLLRRTFAFLRAPASSEGERHG